MKKLFRIKYNLYLQEKQKNYVEEEKRNRISIEIIKDTIQISVQQYTHVYTHTPKSVYMHLHLVYAQKYMYL